MSAVWWGGTLGAMLSCGVLLVVSRVLAVRRPSLADRVLRYVRVSPAPGQQVRASVAPGTAAAGILAPWVGSMAATLDRWLGGATSIQRRLGRAGSSQSVADYRVQQVTWGLAGFAAVAALGLLANWRDPAAWPLVALGCLVGFLMGVMLCDQRLSAAATRRERRMIEEFPVVAELLALAVAAGEGPVQALTRAVGRTVGPMSDELGQVLAQVRTGQPFAEAFEEWGNRTGLAVVNRFARSVAVAVERGTPLADVLHAQVGDVREANRRELIESAARREVAMMAPVVFLVLPVVVMFAFFPGIVGIRLMVS